VIGEKRIGNDMKGSGRGLLQVLTGIYLEGIKETTTNLNQGSWCPDEILQCTSPTSVCNTIHPSMALQTFVGP
jgi:hypothetical protein